MPASPKPFFRFTHSKTLRKTTLSLLDAIDEVDDPTPLRGELSDNILELTDTGMTFFFLEPLGKLKMGFLINQSAQLGVGSVIRLMNPVVRNVVGRMDKKQLRQVSRTMRQMME